MIGRGHQSAKATVRELRDALNGRERGHERSVPPLVLTKVTMAFDVVTLPAESSIEMTGCVANSDPARLGTGSVVKTSCVGVPAAVGEKNPLVAVKLVGVSTWVAVSVYGVPTMPAKSQVATSTTPS